MANGKYQKWLETDNLILIEAWARNGLTDEQIARNMGITASTLYEWKKKFSDISESLKKGKEVVDFEVENALLKRALGYRYKETTQELSIDKASGKEKLKVTKIVEKEVVPDVGAQAFWLKNRKPEEWRDKREVDNHVDFDDDGFIAALKGELPETFKDIGDMVEE